MNRCLVRTAVVLVVPVVASAASVLGYRTAYATCLQMPDRIDPCGRRFL